MIALGSPLQRIKSDGIWPVLEAEDTWLGPRQPSS